MSLLMAVRGSTSGNRSDSRSATRPSLKFYTNRQSPPAKTPGMIAILLEPDLDAAVLSIFNESSGPSRFACHEL